MQKLWEKNYVSYEAKSGSCKDWSRTYQPLRILDSPGIQILVRMGYAIGYNELHQQKHFLHSQVHFLCAQISVFSRRFS